MVQETFVFHKRMHMQIASLYFHARDYGQFCRHLLKGFWLVPENHRRFMMFPLRRLKRRRER